MSRTPPMEVLGESLQKEIAGRRVRCAVFTTYCLDPGFFEENVLPLLFDRPFSQVRKVRMIQLEEALKGLDEIAVYYDRTALDQESVAAQLDVRRIDVRRRTGVFHPKVILLLLDDVADDSPTEDSGDTIPTQSLLVGVLSANVTRSGWWESVEAFHFEEVFERDVSGRRCPFRADLLAFLNQIRRSAPDEESHEALDQIHEFLRAQVPTGDFTNVSARGRYYTQFYFGQESLEKWLARFGLDHGEWNLEVVSPFFDLEDRRTLDRLLEVAAPKACRIYLPLDAEGRACIAPGVFEAIRAQATWSVFPEKVVQRSPGRKWERLAHRRVHAKVYRFWSQEDGEVVLVGSPNLTRAGHAAYSRGNLEAAFLAQVGDAGSPQGWWLEPVEREIKAFSERRPEEDDASQSMPVDLTMSFDWETHTLSYRLNAPCEGSVEVCEPSGRRLFAMEGLAAGPWTALPAEASRAVEEILPSQSFLLLRRGDASWRVLVREERMAYRPSLLTTLTPEEILQYWALLSPAQKAEFLEEKLQAEAFVEGLPAGGGSQRYAPGHTMFDRFAGLFHSFQCLQRHVEESLRVGAVREAEARLFGEKYDSLPVLLEKVLGRVEADPVMAYVTFLCARQAVDALRKENGEFFRDRAPTARRLDDRIAKIVEVRRALPLDARDIESGFLDWYESIFLTLIPQPEAADEDDES